MIEFDFKMSDQYQREEHLNRFLLLQAEAETFSRSLVSHFHFLQISDYNFDFCKAS